MAKIELTHLLLMEEMLLPFKVEIENKIIRCITIVYNLSYTILSGFPGLKKTILINLRKFFNFTYNLTNKKKSFEKHVKDL